MLEGSAKLQANVRGNSAQRCFDRHEAMGFCEKLVVARLKLWARYLEELALEAVGELLAALFAQVVRQSPGIRPEDAQHQVNEPLRPWLPNDVLEERHVTEQAEESQKGQGHELA